MNKILLILSFVISSLVSKSQLLHPQVINSLKNYFFVPVMFDNLGDWIKGIDNDSSIIFKEKTFFLENDSLYLKYELEKPGYPPGYKNAATKLSIRGHTRTVHPSIIKNQVNSIHLNHLNPTKITNLSLSLIITFDSTENGKQMATQLQDSLDSSIRQYFKKRRAYVGNKNLKARNHHHAKTRKCIHYFLNDDPIAIFIISNTVQDNKNQIALYLNYSLIN